VKLKFLLARAVDVNEPVEMQVLERLTFPDIPDVVLAGPVRRGICRAGDRIVLLGHSVEREVTCLGIELLNWGRARNNWSSIRVSDVELEDIQGVTEARAVRTR
jgi:translation elongation factor EF-Tu-like GTPase